MTPPETLEQLNQKLHNTLPAYLGICLTHAAPNEIAAEMPVKQDLMAPNGYLHAGSIVTLADTCAGFGCMTNLPAGGIGFTTIELKSNHLGTARDGTLSCRATLVHGGRTTQVWDAVVTHRDNGKTLALFRCTQMILYPK